MGIEGVQLKVMMNALSSPLDRLGKLSGGWSGPDCRFRKLLRCGFGPATVGGGGGWAGVEDCGDGCCLRDGDALETGFGELADAYGELRLEETDDGLEVLVTGGEECFTFYDREFVRGAVAAAFLHEDEGAVIGDEVVGEEVVGVGILFFEESPEAATGDFRLLASEALDGAFGMLVGWFPNWGFDSHPVADVFDFAKGDSSLRHSPRTRIHAEEEHALS